MRYELNQNEVISETAAEAIAAEMKVAVKAVDAYPTEVCRDSNRVVVKLSTPVLGEDTMTLVVDGSALSRADMEKNISKEEMLGKILIGFAACGKSVVLNLFNFGGFADLNRGEEKDFPNKKELEFKFKSIVENITIDEINLALSR